MDTVTYPSPLTVEFVGRNLIAHRFAMNSPGAKAMEYGIQYTPTVLVLDGRGKEHHRNVGFVQPEEFVPFLMLGVAKAEFHHRRFKQALAMLDKLLGQYPRSRSAPEAADVRKALINR
jgi:hypothetical protein